MTCDKTGEEISFWISRNKKNICYEFMQSLVALIYANCHFLYWKWSNTKTEVGWQTYRQNLENLLRISTNDSEIDFNKIE